MHEDLGRRQDGLFELTDAVLFAPKPRTLPITHLASRLHGRIRRPSCVGFLERGHFVGPQRLHASARRFPDL